MQEELEKIRKMPMLFVLGKARSGTTLLQNLLDAHPGIVGAPESKFAVLLYPKYGHIKHWTEGDVKRFVQDIQVDPMFVQLWSIDKEILTKRLLEVAKDADYNLICKVIYYMMKRDKQDVIYLADKNPEYMLFINTILKIFPETKFIHLIRNPMDNIHSQLTSFKEKNYIFRAYQWTMFNKMIERSKKKMPEKYCTVIYEELVKDTEGNMRRVCEFLGLSFSNPMTQNVTPDWLKTHLVKKGIAETAGFIHRALMQPVNTSNVEKWRKGMNPSARVATERITSEYAKKQYGYIIDTSEFTDGATISGYQLFKGKMQYYFWQIFTQFKYKSFKLNVAYQKLKKRMKGDDLPLWEYF